MMTSISPQRHNGGFRLQSLLTGRGTGLFCSFEVRFQVSKRKMRLQRRMLVKVMMEERVKNPLTVYQRKVDVDMLNVVKSRVLADVSSVSPSSEQKLFCSDEGLTLETSGRRSAYPHQPYVDTLRVLPPRRRRPKLVLTGTQYSIVKKNSNRQRVRHQLPSTVVSTRLHSYSLI